MKKRLQHIVIFFLPFAISFCASAQVESSIDFPAITEANYKQIDTSSQIVGIYLYNSKLGADHIALGDNNAKAFRSVLEPTVKFYKLNVITLSNEAQKDLVEKFLGEPLLPSYLFLYKNKVILKKLGGYPKTEDAIQFAEELKKKIEKEILPPKQKQPKDTQKLI